MSARGIDAPAQELMDEAVKHTADSLQRLKDQWHQDYEAWKQPR